MSETKNRNVMSIKVRTGDEKIVVETYSWFLKDATKEKSFRRPHILIMMSGIGTLYNVSSGFAPVSDDIVPINKVEVVHDLIDGTTMKGNLLLRCLFGLPYVSSVYFLAPGKFEVSVYPPYDLNDPVTAGILECEIKDSVDIAVGKNLKVVEDILMTRYDEMEEEK